MGSCVSGTLEGALHVCLVQELTSHHPGTQHGEVMGRLVSLLTLNKI